MEKKKYKRKPKDLALDLTADIVGSFIFAIGIVSFTQEANIAAWRSYGNCIDY